MKNNHKINILFIASPGRSESTLMERVLNEFSETSAIGELGRRKELTKENICLCGNRFEACPQWQKIINDPKFKEINQEYLSLSKKYMNIPFFIKFLLRSKNEVKTYYFNNAHNITIADFLPLFKAQQVKNYLLSTTIVSDLN